MNALSGFLFSLSPAASVIASIALILFGGFAMTRLTKRLYLPNVTAYIVVGIIMGPFVLNLIPPDMISGMDFLGDIALAFIAFASGEFFRIDALKKNGLKVVIITVTEALTASVLAFLILYFIVGLSLVFSIVLASLAASTASASTLMTIRQTGAKGDYVETLLQVIALDNLIGLMIFQISVSVVSGTETNMLLSVIKPLVINILVMALGALFGLLLKLMMPNGRSTDNRLIISVATLFAFCGVCALFDVSPLLGCMSMSMVYINLTDDDRLFKQLNYFSPPILLMFFVRSGLNFDLSALFSGGSTGGLPILLVSVIYAVVRMTGKYLGAFLGCAMVSKPKNVRNYLGFALSPHAGIAIGLAAYAARAIGGETGTTMQTLIMASSILHELIGPVLTKMSFRLSGAYSDNIEDIVPIDNADSKTEVELLIERINEIQKRLPEHAMSDENEAAFTEAAEEYFNRGRLLRRRL